MSNALPLTWWQSHHKNLARIHAGKYPHPGRRWPTYHEWAVMVVFVAAMCFMVRWVQAEMEIVEVNSLPEREVFIQKLLKCINGEPCYTVTYPEGTFVGKCEMIERRVKE